MPLLCMEKGKARWTIKRKNTMLKSFLSLVKLVSKNFYVDERMAWVEISGLPLCAWGSNAYKKVASLVDKKEDEQEDNHDVEEENEMVKDQDKIILSNTGHAVEEEEIPDIQMDNKVKSSTSDRSRPPGFEHYNNAEKEHSSSSL
ncbi:hypothetical protein Tco_1113378 [Tanacetum coccineum]|uniref:DUF4283 domain-containing protein n=1 Tax=Tanacetum coccineum TaxID=301880 RepID=A0ABQ5ITI6_9ASTR